MGSMLNGPMALSRRSESFRNTSGLLLRLNAMRIAADTTTPIEHPARAPIWVNSAPTIAQTPMASAGTNTFMPMRLKLFSLSSLDGPLDVPFFTRWRMAGMTMSTMRTPSTMEGIQRPNAMTTPNRLQNMQVP